MIKNITSLMVFVILFLTIAACSPSSNPSTTSEGKSKLGSSGGDLVVSALIPPDTMDVQLSSWMDAANSQSYDALLNYDLNGKIAPGIAEKYSISEDGKVWEFTIRKDVKFHSGEPVTAEAVKQSIERFIKISPVKDLAGPITKVESTEPQTVKVYFSEPFAPFITTATGQMIAPIDPKRVSELGDKFGENPSATGPFEFVKYERGSSVTYKKYPEYNWGPSFIKNQKAPYVDTLTFKFLKDDDTRILEFKKGTIQVLQDVPSNYVKELENTPGVEIHKMPEAGMKYVGFNNSKPIFQDIRVKQAISLAIDRKPIIEVALAGLAKPVYGPLPSTVPGYSEKIEKEAKKMYSPNPKKAKALLAEADWKDKNGDGIVEKDGKPLSIELLVTQDPSMQRAAQIMQSQLKEVGIDLKISVNEIATLKDKASKGSFDMFFLYFGYSDPDILYLLFGSEMTNRMKLSNPDLEELLIKGRQTLDEKKRMEVYEKAQEILVKEVPWIPLYAAETVYATRDLEGFKVNPYAQMPYYQDVKRKK